MNSIQFYQALIENGVTSSSLHILPQGGHEIGIAGNPGSSQLWTNLCEAWLKELEYIE